jgi:SAM-dependent methyltransferase
MADTLLPFVSGDVLELGAGMGNLTTLLCTGHARYVATDLDENLLQRLQARIKHCPSLTIAVCDLTKQTDFQLFRNRMDTVICLNVLEHLNDDLSVLGNIYSCLKPGGRALILVPQGMRVFGSLDHVLEHQRRYSRSELRSKMAAAGFTVEQLLDFNRMTYPGWFLNSRILHRRSLSPLQLRLFDTLVPLWRRIDRYLPWPPTSIIGVGLRDK